MPRRLRVEVCGYHHVYNRGVAKNKVFFDDKDKIKFIEILASVSKEYRFNIHSFCLMDNHYHLLVENRRENLSSGIRQLNSQYASYFNKRHKRVGHLWQGRYKSWYVLNEEYLFTLFRYIENNPVKANMTKKVGEYRFCASYSILQEAMPPFLQNTFVLRDFSFGDLSMFLQIPLGKKDTEKIQKLHSTRYVKDKEDIKEVKKHDISSYSLHVRDKTKRNEAVKKAYEDGFNKSQIAREISLSVAGVSKILKKLKV